MFLFCLYERQPWLGKLYKTLPVMFTLSVCVNSVSEQKPVMFTLSSVLNSVSEQKTSGSKSLRQPLDSALFCTPYCQSPSFNSARNQKPLTHPAGVFVQLLLHRPQSLKLTGLAYPPTSLVSCLCVPLICVAAQIIIF